MKKGWAADRDKWYYMNPDNGHIVTGWLNLPARSGTWYYLKANGAMATNADGNINIGGEIYTFKADGVCINPYA